MTKVYLFTIVPMLVAFGMSVSTGFTDASARELPSCMHMSLTAANISPQKATAYEQALAKGHWSEDQIKRTQAPLVAKAMNSSPKEASDLKYCLLRKSSHCFQAKCQNWGTCELFNGQGGMKYGCKCPIYFRGHVCQYQRTPLKAELKGLAATVAEQKKQIGVLQHNLTSHHWAISVLTARQQFSERMFPILFSSAVSHVMSCSRQYLGYQYKSSMDMPYIGHNGSTIDMSFTKKHGNKTALRITYTSTFYVNLTRDSFIVVFSVKIGGNECTSPSKIEMVIQQTATATDINIPIRLEGVCEGTSQGDLQKGKHDVSVHTSYAMTPVIPIAIGHPVTTFFQVQELCV